MADEPLAARARRTFVGGDKPRWVLVGQRALVVALVAAVAVGLAMFVYYGAQARYKVAVDRTWLGLRVALLYGPIGYLAAWAGLQGVWWVTRAGREDDE